MTWYADLGPIDYFPFREAPLVAVGWLDGEHPFDTGSVSAEDFEKLCGLLVSPWQPAAAAGRHRCELCAHTGGPAVVRFRELEVRVGAANAFIPATAFLYAVPSMIVHYIDAHRYRPPAEFLDAVRACPPMDSRDYERALLAAGGRALLRGGEE